MAKTHRHGKLHMDKELRQGYPNNTDKPTGTLSVSPQTHRVERTPDSNAQKKPEFKRVSKPFAMHQLLGGHARIQLSKHQIHDSMDVFDGALGNHGRVISHNTRRKDWKCGHQLGASCTLESWYRARSNVDKRRLLNKGPTEVAADEVFSIDEEVPQELAWKTASKLVPLNCFLLISPLDSGLQPHL
jgi:hypothetical protein